MANIEISSLTPRTTLSGTEEIEVAFSNASYRVTTANLFKTIGALTDAGTLSPSGFRVALYRSSDGAALSTTIGEIATATAGAMPIGGTVNQALIKQSSTDYDADWGTLAIAGGGTGAITAAAARTALGLEIGTDVQAYDAGLLSIAGLTTAADRMIYTTALDTYAVATLTSFARSILDDDSEATFKATVNLEIGTDVQAWSTNLDDFSAKSAPSGTVVGTSDSQTLTNKTIDADNNTITNIGGAEFDTDTADAFTFLNGSALDTPDITVTSNGSTITLNLEKDGGGDIRYYFSDGVHTHDCTPTATVTLTAGTDASPQINYIYILQSNKTLTVSTSSFPSAEHAPVAEVICQSAASLQTDGAYKVHVWTDHVAGSDGQGHLSHLNHWIRDQHATWESGVALTPTVITNGGSEDNVDIATSSGEVLQLHEHTFPAFDTSTGSEIYVVNHNTAAYTVITDLQDADEDDSGNAITNNRYTSLVIWGAVNEDTADCKLFMNFPSAFYTSEADALADSSRYANYTIPANFKGVGFLIARLTLKYTTASSGTWAVTENLDLRGQFPSLAAGGSVAPSTEFADNVFRLFDESDATKELAFQLSGLTTATTRTMTVPDADGTLTLIAATQTLTNKTVALGSNTVSGTAAQFDTACTDDNFLYESDVGAWGTYSPTLSPSSGTFTTTSTAGRYLQIGKNVYVTINAVITDKGTASGSLTVSIPVTAANQSLRYILVGYEGGLNNMGMTLRIDPNTSVGIINYADGATTVIQDGSNFTFTGVYEVA